MRVIFAGGGTGGHLYPAVAMAREIVRRDPGSGILFVGTREGIESRILAEEGWELKTLRVMGMKGKAGTEQVRALAALPRALVDSFSILRSFQPDAVVGVGGYASGPLVLAAFLSGRRTLLQEQNSVPGRTNRLLGRLVKRIYTAYEESGVFFSKTKVLRTGNPVREGIGQHAREEALHHFGMRLDKKTVFVLGGSRGAHAINQIVAQMLKDGAWSDSVVQFLHQTGEADFEEVRQAYASSGVQAEVRPYFKEMGQAYAAADLAVARAGAVTLSELCIAGVPALLVPFPYAADDHQTQNARVTAATGAAEVLIQEALTPSGLGARIQALCGDPDRLSNMRKAALAHARPGAAKAIVDDMERIVRGNSARVGR